MIFDYLAFQLISVLFKWRFYGGSLFNGLLLHLNKFHNNIPTVFLVICASKFFCNINVKRSTSPTVTAFTGCINGRAVCSIRRFSYVMKGSVLKQMFDSFIHLRTVPSVNKQNNVTCNIILGLFTFINFLFRIFFK